MLNIPFKSFVSCEPLYGISLVLFGEVKAATTSPNGDNELPIEAPSLVLTLYKQEIRLNPFINSLLLGNFLCLLGSFHAFLSAADCFQNQLF